VWWQVVSALGSLVVAGLAAVVGAAAFRRTSHAEDVEARVAAVEAEARARTDAAEVGLKYLERSLAAQRDEITRQEGEIGELRGQLTHCREERQAMAAEIAELKRSLP
jgi:chromosome segregation ATPase